MKKGYKLLAGLFVTIIIFTACTKTEIEEKKIDEIDVLENLIVDIKDNKENYLYINEDGIKKSGLNSYGNIKAYSEKGDTIIFLEYQNDSKKINIRSKNESKYIEIKGSISSLKLSNDGKYIFLKEQKDNIISEYSIINTRTLEKKILNDEIFISGDVLDFLNNNEIIFYGVDINKKISGIFIYDISKKTYKLLREIEGKFISYMKVLDSENIFLLAADDDKKYLSTLNLKNGKITYIDSDFKYIQDVILHKDKLYFSGILNQDMNLYMINLDNNSLQRLTFDFPEKLGLDSYLIEKNNKIYFSDINGKLYFYDTQEKSTNILENQNGIYMIMDK